MHGQEDAAVAGLQHVVALHHAGSRKDSVNFAILMSEILENSKVLDAYRAPDELPPAEPPKTAAIDPCVALYSEAKEAKACYAYDVYINSCPAHMLAPMARGYVNEFCKPQETVEVGKTCDDDPSLCNKSQLCGQSLTSKSGKAEWRIDNVSYVTEAKKRGLSCGVKAETTSVEKTCYPTKPEVCSNRRLCFRSTEGSGSSKTWATGSYFSAYVKEAKKRRLSCGVK